MQGIPIGQLLVQQGVLNAQQVEHILKIQKVSHRPFGDLAQRLFGIEPKAIEDAWVEQYTRTVGVADLSQIKPDIECLRLINRRQAWQFHMMPTDRDRLGLNVATDAEHLVKAVNFSARRIDEPVAFLIAQRDQLRDFLMKHYPVPEYMAEYADTM